MEEDLNILFAEVAKRVRVWTGENPILSKVAAIRIALRAGILHTYEARGPDYFLRWTPDHKGFLVPHGQVCVTLARRIVEVVPLLDSTKPKLKTTVKATGAALELAAEHNVDLGYLVGTGSGGKITVSDVRSYLRDED